MTRGATSSRFLGVLATLLSTSLASSAAVDFRRDVAPILASKCLGCHNAQQSKGGFRLDTPEQLFQSGSRKNTPVIPGKPEQSYLLTLLQTTDLKQTLLIQQHADWVLSLVFTLDNHRLISASRDRSSRVFLTGNGDLDATFSEHTAAHAGAGLTRETDKIVSGRRDHRLLPWNLFDGRKSSDHALLKSEIVAVSSQGSHVLAATADGSVHHFLPPKKSGQGPMEPHPTRVRALGIDSSGAFGASGSRDGEVRLWDLEKNLLRTKFIASPSGVTSVATDPANGLKSISSINRTTRTFVLATHGLDRIPLASGTLRLPKGGHIQGIQLKSDHKDGTETFFLSHDSETVGYIAIAHRAKTAKGADPAVVRQILRLPSDGRQPPLRHPGGIQLFEDFLVVGVEDNREKLRSQIQFWDVSNPLSPKIRGPLTITRESPIPKRKTAGAVGIVHRGTRFLAVVANWDSEVLDVYTSNAKPLSDEACRFDLSWSWESALANRTDWKPDQSWGKYQAINLLHDQGGRLMLAGFCTTQDNQDVIDLFEIEDTASASTRIRKVQSIAASLPEGVHFKYGGGISIEPNRMHRLLATGESLQPNGPITVSPRSL